MACAITSTQHLPSRDVSPQAFPNFKCFPPPHNQNATTGRPWNRGYLYVHVCSYSVTRYGFHSIMSTCGLHCTLGYCFPLSVEKLMYSHRTYACTCHVYIYRCVVIVFLQLSTCSLDPTSQRDWSKVSGRQYHCVCSSTLQG